MAASVWANAADTASLVSPYTTLPNGSCNFRPLTSGSRAPTCGCRRFWLDRSVQAQQGACLCACGHHACFHSENDNVSVIAAKSDTNRQTGVTGPITSLPVQHATPSSKPPSGYAMPEPASAPTVQTEVWDGMNAFARWQHPSWVPSTAPPSVTSYQNPVSPNAPNLQPINLRQNSFDRQYMSCFPNMDCLMASPTVEGTPITEEHGPDLHPLQEISVPAASQRSDIAVQHQVPQPAESNTREEKISSQKSTTHSKNEELPTTPVKNTTSLTPDWQNTIKSCMRRLEELESMSFSQVPVEEVQDKFELLDGRLLELEYWKKDVEARHEAMDAANDDAASLASHTSSPTRDNSIVVSRVSELEQRLVDLETARPSYASPWEIEVVLLPFGRTLNGLWHESTEELPTQPLGDLKMDNKTTGPVDGLFGLAQSKAEAWTPDSIKAWANTINPWLWPKAPGPRNTIFRRLQSRGLVRTVSLTDTGAHGIWEALEEAFSDFINASSPSSPDSKELSYQALGQSLLPLRKVRKSSWLQYLKPHELVTSAMWDMDFLNSGILMHVRGGHKRLYLTTAEAYTQPGIGGWTWQQIQDLPRPDDAVTRSDATSTKEVHSESFWVYVEALDNIPNLDTSFASCITDTSFSRQSIPISSDAEQEMKSTPSRSRRSSSSANTITPRISESFPIISKQSQPKRRNSPSCTPIAYQKRRRVSGSPTRRGDVRELTPVWLHEMPTPSMRDDLYDSRSQVYSGRKRGSGEMAYATPHSNNVGHMYLNMPDGGDTEAESVASDAAESENEWDGWDEDDNPGHALPGSSPPHKTSGSEWDGASIGSGHSESFNELYD